jgi:hypothetical protein
LVLHDLLDGIRPVEGLGLMFRALRKWSIAYFKSGRLGKQPRRIASSVSARNQRSTQFNRLELIGMRSDR